jgi:NADPH2:quinone reductase
LRAGERVVTVGTDGSYAELRAAPERFCWAIPPALSTQEAACVPVAFGTADDALFEFGHLQPGQTALVHAGSGGVGLAAIQLAKRAGARVIATASRDDKLERLAELGLEHGINYRATDFVEQVRRLTDGLGADVILESVGGQNLQNSLRCLAYRGRCVSFGDAGRQSGLPIDISTLRRNNQTLTGYFLGAELLFGERAHRVITGHLSDVATGALRVVIDRTFPLSESAAAHAYIESREAFGRVLLKP